MYTYETNWISPWMAVFFLETMVSVGRKSGGRDLAWMKQPEERRGNRPPHHLRLPGRAPPAVLGGEEGLYLVEDAREPGSVRRRQKAVTLGI